MMDLAVVKGDTSIGNRDVALIISNSSDKTHVQLKNESVMTETIHRAVSMK